MTGKPPASTARRICGVTSLAKSFSAVSSSSASASLTWEGPGEGAVVQALREFSLFAFDILSTFVRAARRKPSRVSRAQRAAHPRRAVAHVWSAIDFDNELSARDKQNRPRNVHAALAGGICSRKAADCASGARDASRRQSDCAADAWRLLHRAFSSASRQSQFPSPYPLPKGERGAWRASCVLPPRSGKNPLSLSPKGRGAARGCSTTPSPLGRGSG